MIHQHKGIQLSKSRMSIVRPFQATDLLRINNVNIDAWTETVSERYWLSDGKTKHTSNSGAVPGFFLPRVLCDMARLFLCRDRRS